jgi:hypothetical protein
MLARPVGAFVISNGTARWLPATDYGLIAMMISGVATVWLLTHRRRRLPR